MPRRCRHLLLLCLLLLAGCATYTDRVAPARSAFYEGRLQEAAQTLDRQIAKAEGEAEVLKLERAVVELFAGHPERAEETLREVRDRFDYLEQTDLGEQALSLVSDDNRLAYAGEDYEKILVRSLLALSNLVGEGDDALAYSLQVTHKQQEIIEQGADASGENPKKDYKRVALGAYLHGVLREASHVDYDDAARSIRQAVRWEPEFREGREALHRVSEGRHSAPGNGVLYVFTLVGRGPYKKEVWEMPTQAALLIADRILSHNLDRTLPPTISPVKVPQIVVRDNRVETVRVSAGGEQKGTTSTITDVGELAVKQYEAIYPRIVARAVVRRIVKKGIVYTAKDALADPNNGLADLLLNLAGVVWEASESADTRSWSLLPETIQVRRLELPTGRHRIALRAVGRHGQSGPVETCAVTIADGRNTYALGYFPTLRLAGTILTSEP